MNAQRKPLFRLVLLFSIAAAAIDSSSLRSSIAPAQAAAAEPDATQPTPPSSIFDVDKDLNSAPAANAPPAATGTMVFAESFNESSAKIELKNGATLGPAGSGVSGRDDDRAYVADVRDLIAPQTGPVALIKSPVSVQGLEEATVCLWYKPGIRQVKNVTLFDAGSMTSLWGDGGWTIRLGVQAEKGVMYWFSSGTKGVNGPWLRPGEWIFLAGVWKKSANELTFYQGTKSAAPKVTFKATRRNTVGGLVERGNRDKLPESIGNHASAKYERPFNGSIDNFRIYSMPLDDAALEQIRQADLKNQPPPQF